MKQNRKTASFGFAQTDITPSVSVEMVGFSRTNNKSRGVLHPLKAQVLIFRTADKTICLTAIDSLGFTVKLTSQLRKQMSNVLNVPVDNIMICFSHTHSAPNAAAESAYFTFVCDRICSVLKTALKNMKPFYAGWGIAEHDIGVNRRSGKVLRDPRLGVLKLSKPDGSPALLLLRVSAHANVLTSDNYKISSDYFGVTRQKLSESFGCPVMMIQGASGDLRPRFQQENAEFMEIYGVDALEEQYTAQEKEKYFRQSTESLNKMAESVFQSAASIFTALKTMPVYCVSMCSVRHRFTADVPPLNRAAEIAAEAKEKARIDGTGWLQEVRRLHHEHIPAQTADIEFQYFLLNEGCLCGVPNEIMCEISLDAWHRSKDSLLFLNGYTNGIDSYLPTAEEYDEGGYEVLWSNLIYYPYHGRVMPLNRESARRMASFAVADRKNLLAD